MGQHLTHAYSGKLTVEQFLSGDVMFYLTTQFLEIGDIFHLSITCKEHHLLLFQCDNMWQILLHRDFANFQEMKQSTIKNTYREQLHRRRVLDQLFDQFGTQIEHHGSCLSSQYIGYSGSPSAGYELFDSLLRQSIRKDFGLRDVIHYAIYHPKPIVRAYCVHYGIPWFFETRYRFAITSLGEENENTLYEGMKFFMRDQFIVRMQSGCIGSSSSISSLSKSNWKFLTRDHQKQLEMLVLDSDILNNEVSNVKSEYYGNYYWKKELLKQCAYQDPPVVAYYETIRAIVVEEKDYNFLDCLISYHNEKDIQFFIDMISSSEECSGRKVSDLACMALYRWPDQRFFYQLLIRHKHNLALGEYQPSLYSAIYQFEVRTDNNISGIQEIRMIVFEILDEVFKKMLEGKFSNPATVYAHFMQLTRLLVKTLDESKEFPNDFVIKERNKALERLFYCWTTSRSIEEKELQLLLAEDREKCLNIMLEEIPCVKIDQFSTNNVTKLILSILLQEGYERRGNTEWMGKLLKTVERFIKEANCHNSSFYMPKAVEFVKCLKSDVDVNSIVSIVETKSADVNMYVSGPSKKALAEIHQLLLN